MMEMFRNPEKIPCSRLVLVFDFYLFCLISFCSFDHFSQGNPSLYPHPFGSSYLPSVMSGSSLSHLNRGNLFASQPPQNHHHHHHNCHHQSPAIASPLPSACPKLPRPGVSHPVLVSTAKEDGQSAQPAVSLSRYSSYFFSST